MQNKGLWLVIVLAVVIIVGTMVLWKVPTPASNYGDQVNQQNQPTPISPPPPQSSGGTPAGVKTITHLVHMLNDAFSPATITIHPGEKVTFVNDDSNSHWPASDPHPVHTLCPGFDSLQGVKKGGTYSFTFKEVKVCSYHDHLLPRMKGVIDVVNP